MIEERLNLIRLNIEKVKEKIHLTAVNSGRNPDSIELIAVTKGKTAQIVKAVTEFGINRIGESFIKEALFKIELLADYPIQWHMIGSIQSGKGKNIAANFDVVHSVDKLKTAEEINKFALKYERKIPVYLELNVSGEEKKHGWLSRNQEELNLILIDIEKILELSALDVKGLMTMAPFDANDIELKKIFSSLRKIRDKLEKKLSISLPELSMGMSSDYKIAIAEGATIVRIGTSIFGKRS